MATKGQIKPPIPILLSAYKAASGFRNFAFSTLIFASVSYTHLTLPTSDLV